jgi:hypothetical protein
MNAQRLITQLAQFPDVLRAALEGFSGDDLRWRPADGNWSALEVLGHLADEEVEDFRRRLKLTLERPKDEWPAIDPVGWAVARAYNEADPIATLRRFTTERAASIQWLRGLVAPDWSQAHVHPKFGAITAGQLLASWAAHDSLHLRQLAKRRYQISNRDAGTFTTEYAGAWTA